MVKAELLKSDYLQVDETTLKVLKSIKPSSAHRGYTWVINNPHLIVTFHYVMRAQDAQANCELLEDYRNGRIQADGYGAYENIVQNSKTIKLVYCMVHARRKFVEVAKKDTSLANYALDKMGFYIK